METRVVGGDSRSLRLIDHASVPVEGAKLGIIRHGEFDPDWVDTSEADGVVSLPADYRNHEQLVVETAGGFRLVAPTASVQPGEVILPERRAVTVRIEGVEAASVWMGMDREAPRLAPVAGLTPWQVRFQPRMVSATPAEPVVFYPTVASIGLRIEVSAEQYAFVTDAAAQPFADRLVFRGTRITEERELVEIAIRDPAGEPMDLPAVAYLQLPGGVSIRKRFQGQLTGDQAFNVRRRPEELQLIVRTSRGDTWRETLSAKRERRSRIDLVAPRNAPGFTMSKPNWRIEGLYALFTSGRVRYIPRLRDAVEEWATWTAEEGRMRVVGAEGYDSIWCIGVDGQAAVYRDGSHDLADVPIIGAERVTDETVERRVGSMRGSVDLAFEIQIPGQSREHWIRIDASSSGGSDALDWTKVRSRGIRARIRCVTGRESQDIVVWQG